MESIAAQPPRCATIDLRPNALCSPRQITIVHISDTHDTCYTNIPDGDILIHSGDFTNWGSVDETKRFNAFLRTLPHPNKIVVAGNHEIGYDKADIKHVQRDMFDNVTGHCYLLHDAYCDVLGLRIHGSSWNNIESMAYGASEAFRATAWNKIQSGVHVLVTHQPPFGMFDNTLHGTDAVTEGRWGCTSLRRRVDELKIPLHLYGHVHENAGLNSEGNTTFSNAAMQDYRQPNVITMIVDSAAELTTREDSTFVEDDWTAIQTDVLPKPNRNVLPHDEVVTLPAHNVSLTKYQGCFTPAHEHLWRHGVCPVLTIHINSTTQPVPGPTPTFATVREASVSIQSQTKLPTPSQQFIVYRRPDGVCAIVSDYFAKEESGSLYALTVQPGPRPSPPGFNLPIPSINDEKTYLEFAPCQDFASAFVWREKISRVNVPNSLAFAGFYVMQLCWTLDGACVLTDEVHPVGWGNTHRLTTSTTSGSNGTRHWVFPYSRVETVDYSAEEAALQSAFQHAKMFPLGHIQPQVVGTVSEYNGCISLAHPQLWHYNAAPVLDVDVRQDPTYSTLCLWKQLSPLPQNQQWTVLLDDVNYRGAILSELPSQGGSSSSRAVLTLRPNAASGELQLVCESFSDQRFNSMFVWNVQRLSPDAVGPGFARYSVATFTHISTGALLYAVQPANRSNFVLQARPPNQVPTGATTQWVLPTYIPKGRM